MELNRIYNIDVLEGLKQLEDNSIDCIITSPPYNKYGLNKFNHRKIKYDTYGDNMKEEDYQKWQIEIINEMVRVIKPTGSIFYNHKNRRVDCKEYSPLEWLLKIDGNIYQTIIWDRKATPSIFNTFLMPTYEQIYWITKTNKTPKVYRERLDKNNMKAIWEINASRSKIHPATFPEKLVENCILLSTDEGDVILDTFSGIGTTANVAKKLNRDYIGFEISENYIKNIKLN